MGPVSNSNASSNASHIAKVLDRVNLVVFQTRIVSSTRDTGEGKKAGSRIEKVLQSCFDPSLLRPLGRKKQEATRICRNFGTKVDTLNAWAVPLERTQELLEQLSVIASQWRQIAVDLSQSMHAQVEAWAAANPAEAQAIRDLAPSAAEVQESTRFIYTSFRLRSDDIEDNGCLEADLGSLAGRTLNELALSLRDAALDKSTGDKYTQGVKDVLGRLEMKAQSLAFLDRRIAEVASVLGSTIALLPPNGLICDAHAVLVKSVVDQMLDPSRLMRYGFSKIERPSAVAPSDVPGVDAQANLPFARRPMLMPIGALVI